MEILEVIGGVAILDANIVYPIKLTDFFLTAASLGLLRPLVSPAIVAEARRHIIKDNPDLAPAKIDRRFKAVVTATPGSEQTQDELTDPLAHTIVNAKDHHVLAAALHHDAGFVITSDKNLVKEINEWRRQTSMPHPIWGAITPNDLASHLVDLEPELVILTIRRMADRTKNPPHTATEILQALAKDLPALRALTAD